MSNYLGNALFCQQREEGIVISASSPEELRVRLEEQGWAPYGTGVTPLAEENVKRGEFSCRRCTNELVEQRLNRIAAETIKSLHLECEWWVIRDQNSPNDFLHVKRADKIAKVTFEHRRTDREMREELAKAISAALLLKA
jgi:hypothetical protein